MLAPVKKLPLAVFSTTFVVAFWREYPRFASGPIWELLVSAVPDVVVEIEEVVARLAQFGFPAVEELHSVLVESNLARMSCTKLDPPTLAGTITWGVTVRVLRRQQMPNGWTKKDTKGFSRTISSDGKRQIVVRTGSEATGRQNGNPTTRAPLKKEMLAVIAVNFQLDLGVWPVSDTKPEPETWLWLIRHARTAQGQRRIYSELSLPDGRIEKNADGRNRIAGWKTRIILPRLDIDGDGTMAKVPAASPDIDVTVARRVG